MDDEGQEKKTRVPETSNCRESLRNSPHGEVVWRNEVLPCNFCRKFLRSHPWPGECRSFAEPTLVCKQCLNIQSSTVASSASWSLTFFSVL